MEIRGGWLHAYKCQNGTVVTEVGGSMYHLFSITARGFGGGLRGVRGVMGAVADCRRFLILDICTSSLVLEVPPGAP